MLLLKISFEALYEKEEEFKQVLDTLSPIIPSLKNSQQIIGAKDDRNFQFSLVQEFKSRVKLDEFLNLVEFRQMMGALIVLGNIVEAKLYTASTSEPLDHILNLMEPRPEMSDDRFIHSNRKS
jgi:hypothetical protein